MDNKKLTRYALIGGLALVGAAVAYYMIGKKQEEEADGIQDELDKVGDVEMEEGHIRFDQFLKIFQICTFHGANVFAVEKKDLVARRRKALDDGNEELYEQIVLEMMEK